MSRKNPVLLPDEAIKEGSILKYEPLKWDDVIGDTFDSKANNIISGLNEVIASIIPNDDPFDIACSAESIIERLNRLREDFEICKTKSHLSDLLVEAISLGEAYREIDIMLYEKSTIHGLKIEKNCQSKDDCKHWADRLEAEYKKQPKGLANKSKVANCYFAIDVEYERVTGKAPKPHKTYKAWWNKFYPEHSKRLMRKG